MRFEKITSFKQNKVNSFKSDYLGNSYSSTYKKKILLKLMSLQIFQQYFTGKLVFYLMFINTTFKWLNTNNTET